jgi:hypothetical protein
MSRCYEFRQFYKKVGRKPKKSQKMMTYMDYLKKSDYKNKEYWIKFYKNESGRNNRFP